MKKEKQYFDYLFYCTYQFMVKIKNSRDRVDDVVFLLSTLFSFPLFGIVILLRGFFFEKGYTATKLPHSAMSIIAIILVFGSMYFTDKYFTKDDRHQKIITFYGVKPTKKHIIIGFFFFTFCVSMVGVVALGMFLFMKITH